MDTPIASRSSPAGASTREQLLGHAQRLIRTRGCNAFSYRDLAELVGVKTSSIHYYFPCKDDLVFEAIESYSKAGMASVHAIDASLPARTKLDRYVQLHMSAACCGEGLCLGGMLAADLASLPERVRASLQCFFRAHESWLAQVLAEGAQQGSLQFRSTPEDAARTVFAAIQGSALAARLFKEPQRLQQAVAVLYTDPRPEGED